MDTRCQRLDGKVVIVTGAASGIGRAIARRFSQEGARVVVADLPGHGGQDTVRTIEQDGGIGRFAACDVADAIQVQGLMRDTVEQYGRIDVLVNNAGIPGGGTPADTTPEEAWDQVIAVNLRGVFLCAKYAIPHLRAAGGGAIVNIASTFGLVGAHNAPAYCASKGGVIALTRQLAVDYAPDGIRVNCLCPGYVDTDLGGRRARMDPVAADRALAERERAAALQPIGRQAQPDEIAAAAVYLAADESAFVIGAVLPVDGGTTAHFNLGLR